jgi:hypothetical protein
MQSLGLCRLADEKRQLDFGQANECPCEIHRVGTSADLFRRQITKIERNLELSWPNLTGGARFDVAQFGSCP